MTYYPNWCKDLSYGVVEDYEDADNPATSFDEINEWYKVSLIERKTNRKAIFHGLSGLNFWWKLDNERFKCKDNPEKLENFLKRNFESVMAKGGEVGEKEPLTKDQFSKFYAEHDYPLGG